MSTNSALSSFIKSLIDEAPECEDTMRRCAPSSLFTVSGRSRYLALQTKGRRLGDRQKLWNEEMVTFHKTCLRETVELITMQKKNIRLYQELIAKADRGIPLGHESVEENQIYLQLEEQWRSFLAHIGALDLLYKKTHGNALPAAAIAIEREMVIRRAEVLPLAKETAILHAKLHKSLATIQTELDCPTEETVDVKTCDPLVSIENYNDK